MDENSRESLLKIKIKINKELDKIDDAEYILRTVRRELNSIIVEIEDILA